MIGRQVKHKAFGIGTIVKNEEGKIAVDFAGTIRVFQFPQSFECFLSSDDAVLQNQVACAQKKLAEFKQKAEEERQRAKEVAENIPPATKRTAFSFSVPSQGKAMGRKKEHIPLESVAFKCNYCDGGKSSTCIGFNGKCSDAMIRYNIDIAKHVVCSASSVCKRYHDGLISRTELDSLPNPCQESLLHDEWTMAAGYYQTGPDVGKPIHMNRLCGGSLAVLTSRKPGDNEAARFVFAAFLVNSAYGGDDQETGSVVADPVWRVELMPGQAERILFWNYYYNKRSPEKIAYGSGLYRYLTETEAAQILRDIANVKGDDYSESFYMHFCEISGIDPKNLEPPSGALLHTNRKRS